ncbi:esterase-like activity of phytase family protein [Xanthomonas hydrangeae]|uniref:Esterase-like activity of phytase family protein n=1 Tax=Xanthomonas hydrangeae TaxID=2775159 RepID=A0AAU0BD97_9XANT|nr:esterase-like activity of phytase family protein [Xanthomonas hydrangeae]WOB49877.1 esterase-like activity of phytase family protein [Xanthomonas hydrangeae]
MHLNLLLTAGLATVGLLTTCTQDPHVTTGIAVPSHTETSPPQINARSDRHRFTFPPTARVGNVPLTELSALAWDADEQLLYALSDTGYVFHFRLNLDDNEIVSVEPVHSAALVDAKTGLTSDAFNAEGLALNNAANGVSGDTELVVSLEDKPSRIVRFTPTGNLLGELAVPSPADDLGRYRKKGRGLEAVALHPAYGLLTAPESPLLEQPEDRHTVYAKHRRWSFLRHSPDSRLKGLDVLPDGSLLVLERDKVGAKDSFAASVRRLDLAACSRDGSCATDTVAILPVGRDNFEGMSVIDLRHILLVSDNAGLVTQDTTFVLVRRP